MTTPSTRPPSASSPGPEMGAGSGTNAFGRAGAFPGVDDGPDPELLALPGPPKRERTLTVVLLAVTALASLGMVIALSRDAVYGLTSAREADSSCTGEVTSLAGDALTSLSNRYACGNARLGASGGVRFERPFATDSFRILPALGRQDLWVELRVPHGQENGRYVPPSFVGGRMVRFDEAGLRHRGLASAIDMTTGTKVPEGAYLLVADEGPSNARWACVLVVMFAAFFGWNVVAAARLLRRVS